MSSIIFIENIDPSKEIAKIQVRCVRLWPTFYSNNPNQRFSIELIFEDEKGGQIQASLRNYLFTKYEPRLQEGSFYQFSNFEILQNEDDYQATHHTYRLAFHNFTSLRQLGKPLTIPMYGFRFVEFSDILSFETSEKHLVDIIGEVIACQDLATVEKTGNIYTTARLRDSFGETIDCTFWNSFARQMTSHWELGVEGPIVVILTMAMIRKFGVRRCLQNSKYGSRLYILEDIPEIKEYKAKLKLPAHSEQSARSFSTLDKSQNSQEDFDLSLAFKGIAELQEINEEGFFVIYGTILNIQSAYNWYYKACSKHNTKVDEAPNSTCRKCNSVPKSTELKYKLTVRIQDETGMASFVLFTPHIYPIVQKTAADLKKALEDEGDFESFPDELDMLIGKKFLFKVEIQKFTLTQKTRIYTVSKLCHDQDVINLFVIRPENSNKGKNVVEEVRNLSNDFDDSMVSSIGDSIASPSFATPNLKRGAIDVIDVDARDNEAQHSVTSKIMKIKVEKDSEYAMF